MPPGSYPLPHRVARDGWCQLAAVTVTDPAGVLEALRATGPVDDELAGWLSGPSPVRAGGPLLGRAVEALRVRVLGYLREHRHDLPADVVYRMRTDEALGQAVAALTRQEVLAELADSGVTFVEIP